MNRPLLFLAVLGTFLPPARGEDFELKRFEFEEPHMGTRFRIAVYAKKQEQAQEAAKAAFARVAELNRIMSDYDPASELMQLCARFADTVGPPVKISTDLHRVLTAARALSEKSDGAFDITVGPLVQLWRRSRLTQRLPDPKELADAKARTGYKHIELRADGTVRLLKPGMRLDLGGIAKGYAADEALALITRKGMTRALVAAGGDVVVSDSPPSAAGWTIEIAPLAKDQPKRMVMLRNAAVSTSGDREQFVVIDGVRYSHIVDPRTGLGQTGQRLVTVIAPTGMQADSMTKAVALMEQAKAMTLVDSTKGAAALVVVQNETGREVRQSQRFALFLALTGAKTPQLRYLKAKDGSTIAVQAENAPLAYTEQVFPADTKADANAQARQVIADLQGLLMSVQSSLANAVRVHFYVANPGVIAHAQKALAEYCPLDKTPAMTFVVTSLPFPGAVLAADAIAKFDAPLLCANGISFDKVRMTATNRRVYVSGQAEKGASPVEAARKTLESLTRTLRWLKLDAGHILHLKAFLTHMTAHDDVRKAIRDYFGEQIPPPMSFVEWKSSLPIEIELIVEMPEAAPANAEVIEFLTPPGMSESPVYCRVTRVNSATTIYTAGLSSRIDGSGENQVADIFDQLDTVLKKTGSDLRHLAKATYYVADDDCSAKLNSLRPKFYDPKRPPAASKAMVSGVGIKDRGISLDMIAVPVKN